MVPTMGTVLVAISALVSKVLATSDGHLVGIDSYLVARQAASSNTSSFAGYQIYTEQSLALDNVDANCEKALTSVVHCDSWTLSFQANSYRGSLGNDSLTASVCDPGCGKSLQTWFTAVSKACGSDDDTDLPWEYAGGKIWAGYNETCLKDPDTGNYCNDIIADYPANETKAETCSYCNTHRLSIMQESQYSEYDARWQRKLESVNKVCSLSLPTDLPPPLFTPPKVDPPPCYSTTYTTQKGDSCDSIALANKVSSYALYTGNAVLLSSCKNIPAGVELCIPASCTTYTIKDNETCTSIEIAQGMDFGTLNLFNAWIWPDCSNMESGVKNYGSVICVDPQGGVWNASSPVGTPVGNGGASGPFSVNVTAPPNGSTVATGTTRKCGVWYVPVDGDSCTSIMVRNGIPASLFFRINPSLHKDSCDKDLSKGKAYCISPTYGWSAPPMNATEPSSNGTTSSSSSLSSSSASSTSLSSSASSSSVPSTTSSSSSASASPSGIASDCISFYIVEKGDTCPLIVLKFITQLNLADLLAWNLQLGLDCSGLHVGLKLCVGV